MGSTCSDHKTRFNEEGGPVTIVMLNAGSRCCVSGMGYERVITRG